MKKAIDWEKFDKLASTLKPRKTIFKMPEKYYKAVLKGLNRMEKKDKITVNKCIADVLNPEYKKYLLAMTKIYEEVIKKQ